MEETLLYNILKKLEEAQILRRKGGVFELKHDSLASKIAKRRSQEQQKITELYHLVRQNMNSGGMLTEYQLSQIDPIKEKIKAKCVNDDEKQKFDDFIELCKAHHKKAEQQEEAQYQREVTLRKKAIRRKNVAILFAGVVAVLAGWGFWQNFKAKMANLTILENNFYNSVHQGDYEGANNSLTSIHSMRKWLPFFLTHDTLTRKLDSLERLLIFHYDGSQIKTTDNYIAISKGPIIRVIRADTNTSVRLVIFDSMFNYRYLTNVKFSKNTDDFFTGEPYNKEASSNHDDSSIIKIGTILLSDSGKVKFENIDTVDVVAADFDTHGDLFYYKKGTIWKYDKKTTQKGPFLNLNLSKEYLAQKSGITIEFFRKDNLELSDFFKLTIASNKIYVIKREDPLIRKELNGKIEYSKLDDNRYFIYGEKSGTDPSLLNVSAYDLENCNLTNSVPDFMTVMPIMEFPRFTVYDHLNIAKPRAPEHVFSPDLAKSIKLDEQGSKMIISNGTGEKYILPEQNERIMAYTALDSVYAYVCQNIMTGKQTIYFKDYGMHKSKYFTLLEGFSFKGFENKKYMIFEGQADQQQKPKEAVLMISPFIFKRNYVEAWYK
jgi:hypothetical protein